MADKKYSVICKVGPGHFIKWRVNSLRDTKKGLNECFPNWCYANVFCKVRKIQVGSFTSKGLILGNISLEI